MLIEFKQLIFGRNRRLTVAGPVENLYAYVIKDRNRRTEKGKVRAESLRAAIKKLQKKAFQIDSVQRISDNSPDVGKRWKLNDLLLLFRELSVLHRSGLHLQQSFHILAQQNLDSEVKTIILGIGRNIGEGKSFSESLAQYPSIFSKFHRSIIRAAEEGGFMDHSIEYLATVLEKEMNLRQKVRHALSYPLTVFGVGLFGSWAIFYWLFPYLQALVRDMNVSLPLYSQMLLNIASAFQKFHILIPVIILVLIGSNKLAFYLKHSLEGQRCCEKILLGLPLVGRLKIKAVLTHSLLVWASLLHSGVKVTNALDLAADTCDTLKVSQAFQEVADQVREGASIEDGLKVFPEIFPRNLIAMVAVGESTGELPDVLEKIVDYYEVELNSTIETFSKLVEPLAIGVLGLFVAFILISFFVPIYQTFNHF
jgi:type IV pilus assembly protein PilC